MKCKRCKGTGVEKDWLIHGKFVRRIRVRAGLSLREAARRAGCSATHACNLEMHGFGWTGPRARAYQAVVYKAARR